MKKLIFSLALVILLFGLNSFASTVYYGYARGGFGASYSFSGNSFDPYYTTNAGFYNPGHVNVVNAKPWHAYALAVARAPAPTFRSMPAGGFYGGGCTFVSKTAPYSFYNIKKGYVQGYYWC